MEKVIIELPEVVKAFNGLRSSETRQTAMGYTVDGKFISKEEASAVIQKWFEQIKKLVPQTVLSSDDVELLYEDTPKEKISDVNEPIDSIDRIWKVTFLSVAWIVTGEDNEEINLLNLELQIKCGKQRAWICGFGGTRFPEVDVDFPTWEEGVKKYLEIGQELLNKYGPTTQIPLPA